MVLEEPIQSTTSYLNHSSKLPLKWQLLYIIAGKCSYCETQLQQMAIADIIENDKIIDKIVVADSNS